MIIYSLPELGQYSTPDYKFFLHKDRAYRALIDWVNEEVLRELRWASDFPHWPILDSRLYPDIPDSDLLVEIEANEEE